MESSPDLVSTSLTEEHKSKLTTNHVLIVENLQDVESVAEYLKIKGCITEGLRQKVVANATQQDRNRYLVNILRKGSEATFYEFLQALQHTQDTPQLYNLLGDELKSLAAEGRRGPPLLGAAKEYYVKLRDFHKRKLEKLAREKPPRHELTSYVHLNMYPQQQDLHNMRRGFREVALDTVRVVDASERKEPHKVLLLGSPGVGKTLSAYHFLSENINGTLWKDDVHFIIFILLRELNRIKSNMSFRDILFNAYGPSVGNTQKVWEYLEKNQDKLLTILDGYDEYEGLGINVSYEYQIPFHATDQPTIAQILIYNLVLGNIFPGSKVLVTGRPHILEHLQSKVDRTVELPGLNRAQLDEMTHIKLKGNPNLASQAITFLNLHQNIANICCIPANAKGFLEHVHQLYKDGNDDILSSLPNTRAGLLFMLSLNHLKNHDRDLKDKQNLHSKTILEQKVKILRALAKIAFEGLFGFRGINQLFDEDEVTAQGITVEEVTGSGLMTGHLSAVEDLFNPVDKLLLQFQHLTFQEHFAALELSQVLSQIAHQHWANAGPM